jgi:gliding motility-associated lipoprotein GldB
MKPVKQLFFASILFAAVLSCKTNPLKVDVSDIKNDIKVVRFDKELFSLNSDDTLKSLTVLSNKYPEFFDLFTWKVIQIGGIGDSLFIDGMKQFLTDTMILKVKKLVDAEFSDFEKTENQLNKAFKYFQYHFPDKELPTVYAYFSGFNQSVVTAENIIGISLDKYLGRDCEYYRMLNSTPQYKILNMHKDKIVSDVAYAWGVTEFENSNNATTVLDNMIQQGKLMYFVDAMLPEMHDSLKIGYTKLQLDWCKKNEAQMWSQLIELKMLYSNKRMDIIRYINASPTTSGFPLESPGRTGVWIGWQIVRKYMKKFPETTLADLMKNNDYQQILNDSKYFPE